MIPLSEPHQPETRGLLRSESCIVRRRRFAAGICGLAHGAKTRPGLRMQDRMPIEKKEVG